MTLQYASGSEHDKIQGFFILAPARIFLKFLTGTLWPASRRRYELLDGAPTNRGCTLTLPMIRFSGYNQALITWHGTVGEVYDRVMRSFGHRKEKASE